MLDVRETSLPGVKVIALRQVRDARGFVSETYSADAWREAGIPDTFVQDNHAYNAAKHTVRGLHFQSDPRAQGKLVRVVRGAILDVAVDLRRGGATFGRHVATVISAAEWNCAWVPRGFAHGFCTLEPDTEVLYKLTQPYAPAHEHGLLWNDPELGIAWPVSAGHAIVSSRDCGHPRLRELTHLFG